MEDVDKVKMCNRGRDVGKKGGSGWMFREVSGEMREEDGEWELDGRGGGEVGWWEI